MWLQLLLVGALASVAILVVQLVRTARNTQEVTVRALRDYGAFAAWSYREHLVADLRSMTDEVLGPVNHGDGLHTSPRIPSAQDLGHLLPWSEACQCHDTHFGPLPVRYYAFALGTDTLGVGGNYQRNGHGWLADPPPGTPVRPAAFAVPQGEARWLNSLLTGAARLRTPSTWSYRLFVEPRAAFTRVLVSRLMPTQRGDTLIYAVEYSRDAVATFFRGILARSDLLPPSLVKGRPNESIIDLEVSDRTGTPIFASRAAPRWDLAEVNVLAEDFSGLRVRAQVRPEIGETLLIGGAPESRIPVLLVMLVLALGLTLVAAVQLRRDVRFAAERAQFVANVSHELRTPLAQVRLVLDTIRLGRATEPAVRESALGLADREVLRLQHLVEGLLRFTRGPRRSDAARVDTDVAAEARSVAREFESLAAPRGITIEVTGVPAATARLERGALRQVLLNLLDNAVKYGRDGAPVVVDVSVPDGEGPRVAVTDSGPGVPQAEQRRIWSPFERGVQAEARAAGGSGIGLTIVRDIAADHGGRAWVEDAPGGGARFVFQLPRTTA